MHHRVVQKRCTLWPTARTSKRFARRGRPSRRRSELRCWLSFGRPLPQMPNQRGPVQTNSRGAKAQCCGQGCRRGRGPAAQGRGRPGRCRAGRMQVCYGLAMTPNRPDLATDVQFPPDGTTRLEKCDRLPNVETRQFIVRLVRSRWQAARDACRTSLVAKAKRFGGTWKSRYGRNVSVRSPLEPNKRERVKWYHFLTVICVRLITWLSRRHRRGSLPWHHFQQFPLPTWEQ
jgi:hypothetical protein